SGGGGRRRKRGDQSLGLRRLFGVVGELRYEIFVPGKKVLHFLHVQSGRSVDKRDYRDAPWRFPLLRLVCILWIENKKLFPGAGFVRRDQHDGDLTFPLFARAENR